MHVHNHLHSPVAHLGDRKMAMADDGRLSGNSELRSDSFPRKPRSLDLSKLFLALIIAILLVFLMVDISFSKLSSAVHLKHALTPLLSNVSVMPTLPNWYADKVALSGESPTAATNLASPGKGSGSSQHTMHLYELYYTTEAHPVLHDTAPWIPMCVISSALRPNSHDVDASLLFPLIQDSAYQALICEYGAMFALANNWDALQGSSEWAGFISWRAAQKNRKMEPAGLEGIIRSMATEQAMAMPWAETGSHSASPSGFTFDSPRRGVDMLAAAAFLARKPPNSPQDLVEKRILYFWSDGGISFYEECDKWHVTCSRLLAHVFSIIFGDGPIPREWNQHVFDGESPDLSTTLPPMPTIGGQRWVLMSYWGLHREAYVEYMALARMFLVTLESVWQLHDDVQRCPLTLVDYPPRLCWCFMLERLVNIWAYHAGLRMVYIEPSQGVGVEQHPIGERDSVWLHWFSRQNVRRVERSFAERLPPESLELYRKLGG
eukprot:TRINITY_DN2009_c0_g1_i2.p1 TRINITY_DN2009_c0_g1~~TRINITY_DN2009_c0_g1_i2.p1  ORF type:complete len:491 (-),score=32.58 TRINITY_DN2009_c0_g1_i2:204-1676(-)